MGLRLNIAMYYAALAAFLSKFIVAQASHAKDPPRRAATQRRGPCYCYHSMGLARAAMSRSLSAALLAASNSSSADADIRSASATLKP